MNGVPNQYGSNNETYKWLLQLEPPNFYNESTHRSPLSHQKEREDLTARAKSADARIHEIRTEVIKTPIEVLENEIVN